MARPYAGVLGLLIALAFASASTGQTADPAGRIGAVVPPAATPIRLDGRLDEAAWQHAVDLGPLTQREPVEGAEPSERTVVLLTYDQDTLYIGVRCDDREPSKIVRIQMARDADQQNDDSIEIVLDTFLDHRNGYYFQVNALGARTDGIISNNADPKKEWDGIWDAASVVSEAGWSTEIAIPFKTLNFDPGGDAWGFNLQRTIRRRQETIRWRAARQNMRLAQVSEAGPIAGFGGRRQGHGLDIRPYGLGRGSDERGTPPVGEVDAGLDVFKNFTPSLTGTLTVNTDFAETEVDARQINLTRFSLFFPEKRTFFLQNAEIFQTTGQGQRIGQPSTADLVPFHSRRIGLTSAREPVPILAGGKLTGRAGDWNIGVLDVQTGTFQQIDSRNFFVARIARNLGRQSIIGGLVTYGDPEASDPRPLAGLDGRYERSDLFGSRNFVAEGSVFRTFTDDPAATSGLWAATLRLDYPNDPLGINVSYKQIGERFSPGLGFVPRLGIRKGSYNIDYFQRPRNGVVRHQHWELLVDTVHDPDWRVLNWRIFTAPLNLRFESGDRVEWNFIPQYEYLDVPFAIRPGVIVPAGGYTMKRYRAEFGTATKRRLVYNLSVQHGDFYGGRRVETTTSLQYRPGIHVTLQLSLNRNDVDLPQGAFTTQIWQGRFDVGFTPDLNLSNTLQYDTDSRVAGLNTRLRWTFGAGNDVFVVVNLGRQNTLDGWERVYDVVTTKVQYTWRF